METVTVELRNDKALKLLEDLEEMDIIKLHKTEERKIVLDKASKYRGALSMEAADSLLKHVEESRNEWEERLSAK